MKATSIRRLVDVVELLEYLALGEDDPQPELDRIVACLRRLAARALDKAA
jgi:polynucleotide 5'-kinase involved in rRNA processing